MPNTKPPAKATSATRKRTFLRLVSSSATNLKSASSKAYRSPSTGTATRKPKPPPKKPPRRKQLQKTPHPLKNPKPRTPFRNPDPLERVPFGVNVGRRAEI